MRYLLLIAGMLLACSEGQSAPQSKGGGGPPPHKVVVAKAEAGDLETRASYLGRVESANETPVAAALAGRVRTVAVREGDRVEAGQLLVTLDARRVSAQVAAASARVKRTTAQFEQARRQRDRLAQTKAALSEPERERFILEADTLEAQLAMDEAELRRIRVEQTDHRITAPFTGVVSGRHIDPGAWIEAGKPVIDLISADEVEVMVDVPFEAGRQVSVGTQAQVLRQGESTPAEVVGVVPALDPTDRMMAIRLAPKERPSWLVPGLPVDVELPVSISGQGVLVPKDALVQGPISRRVVVVRDGVGVPVDVDVLGTSEGRALVSGEGLSVGDEVVTRGNERYRPGTPIQITNPAAGEGPAPTTAAD